MGTLAFQAMPLASYIEHLLLVSIQQRKAE
jgi:hypothetical protein